MDDRQTNCTRFPPIFRDPWMAAAEVPRAIGDDRGHAALPLDPASSDLNGRWQPVETRNVDIRSVGSSERLEERTIRRQDLNGTLAMSERSVTRQSEAPRQEQEVVERYSSQVGSGIASSQ
jgi:hypothetical protein